MSEANSDWSRPRSAGPSQLDAPGQTVGAPQPAGAPRGAGGPQHVNAPTAGGVQPGAAVQTGGPPPRAAAAAPVTAPVPSSPQAGGASPQPGASSATGAEPDAEAEGPIGPQEPKDPVWAVMLVGVWAVSLSVAGLALLPGEWVLWAYRGSFLTWAPLMVVIYLAGMFQAIWFFFMGPIMFWWTHRLANMVSLRIHEPEIHGAVNHWLWHTAFMPGVLTMGGYLVLLFLDWFALLMLASTLCSIGVVLAVPFAGRLARQNRARGVTPLLSDSYTRNKILLGFGMLAFAVLVGLVFPDFAERMQGLVEVMEFRRNYGIPGQWYH